MNDVTYINNRILQTIFQNIISVLVPDTTKIQTEKARGKREISNTRR